MNSKMCLSRDFVVVIAVVFAVVSISACSFDLAIPEGVQVRCGSNDECPEGLACARTGLCVDADRIAEAAITFSTAPALDRALLSCTAGNDLTTVSFVLDKVPARMGAAIDDTAFDCAVPDAEGAPVACSTGPALLGACGDDAAAAAANAAVEGVHQLIIEAEDDLGNVARAALPLVFDFTPPALLDGSTQVSLFPAATNPRRSFVVLEGQDLTAATDGTIATVGFALDEVSTIDDLRVGALSILRAVDDAEAGPVTDIVALQVQRKVDASWPEGRFAVVADVVDEAGNRAVLDLARTIDVDRTPPAPLAIDAVELRRHPWGSVDAGGDPDAHLDVTGAAAATLEPLAIVEVVLESDSVLQEEAAGDGSFVVSAPGDSRTASARVVDAAGNVSADIDVANVVWTASLLGKVPGSTFENPQVLTEVPRFGAAQTSRFDREVRTPDAAAVADAATVSTNAALAVLQRSFASTTPTLRRSPLLGRDERTGRLLFTSGALQTGVSDDRVYVINNDNLVEVAGTSNLPPRADAATAYDKRRGVFVLFGGLAGGSVSSETWESDDGLVWRERVVDGPPARAFARAVYDEDRGVVVVFGGRSGATNLGDTWTFDGTTWTELLSASAPSARAEAGLGFLPGTGVVLFGGSPADITSVNDETWVLDGNGWRQVTTSTTPPARFAAALAADPASGSLLMFGGGLPRLDDIPGFDDTWLFDGSAWSAPLVFVRPDPRFRAGIATDVDGQRILLMGGEEEVPNIGSGFTGFSDVWEWTGFWSRIGQSRTGPPALENRGVAFDPARDEVVWFAGSINAGVAATFNVTDTWNGSSATRENPAFDMDAATNSSLAAFRRGVIAIGVNDTQTFRWSGSNWGVVAGNPPDVSDSPLLVLDETNDRLVATGNGKTFTYDGTTWTQVCTFGGRPLCPRAGAATAFDRSRGVVVAYDGTDVLTWNGTVWQDDNLVTLPTPTTSGTLVWDDARQSVLMVRGDIGGRFDVHVYDDGAFVAVDLAEEPIARGSAAIVYDDARDEVVIAGGHSRETNASTNELLTFAADARPAHVFSAALGSAGRGDAAVVSVTLDLVASGVSAAGVGVDVFVWRNGAWEPVIATVGAADRITAVVDDDRVGLAPFGQAESLLFAWSPQAAGLGAVVSTDEVSVSVRYRR